MEFPVVVETTKSGSKPSCDGNICVPLRNAKPLILYEYKPVVDMRMNSVDHRSLMEVLIQGVYCLNQYRVSTVIQCLTDLQQSYYFGVDKVGSTQVKYTWYKGFHDEILNLKTHLDFLYPVINKLLYS